MRAISVYYIIHPGNRIYEYAINMESTFDHDGKSEEHNRLSLN